MKTAPLLVVLLLLTNIIMSSWFIFYQSHTYEGLLVKTPESLLPDRPDLISALKALGTDVRHLSAHDAEQGKDQFAEIAINYFQLASNISAMIGNTGVLCQNEKAQSGDAIGDGSGTMARGNQLSISEQNAGLRNVLLADDADGVAADATTSPPDKLAAALEWTRRREQGLLDQVKAQTLEIARIRSTGSEKMGVPTHASAASGSNQSFAASPWPKDSRICDGDSPAFRTLFSSEGSFEGGVQDGPRIDSITQRELIQFKYHVAMCTNSGGLSGVFRVHKLRDCDETEHIMDDAELSRMVKELYGPDEFTLTLVGPEMLSLIPQMKYHGSCR
jgi:hypothetical protein